MNTKENIEDRNEQRSIVKHKFTALTDNDLMFAQVKNIEILGKLQFKLGKTKEELDKLLVEL